MWSIATTLYRLIDGRTRRGLVGLIAIMTLGMVLEMAGIGIFLPLFQLIMVPEKAMAMPVVMTFRHMVGGGDVTRLVVIASAGILGVFIVKAVVLSAITHHQNRFVTERHAYFAETLLAGYVAQPYLFHVGSNSAELIRNVTVLSGRVFVKGLLPMLQIVTELLAVSGVMVVLLLVDPVSTLSVGGTLGLILAAFYLASRRSLYRWGERTVYLDTAILKAVHQALGGIKAIKVGKLQSFFIAAFARPIQERARYIALGATLPQLPRLFIEVVAVAALLGLMVIVSLQGRTVSDVLPTLGIFAMAVARLMPSFSRIIANLGLLKENASSFNTLYASRGVVPPAEPADSPGAVEAAAIGDFRLAGVSFRYPGAEQNALSEIELTARHGEFIALVGRSGSGKTTLADIILGLLEPTAGQVLIDGRDYRNEMPAWQRRIGYVPQEIYLIDDTLRRNIALGIADDQVSAAALNQAVADARLNEVLAGLPQGLDTLVGERGARLSGGQRQRIGIARALYRNPDVLILDEATSALDNETEAKIVESFNRLHGQKTLVVIAHRLSTVRPCDRLIFLDRGRVVDSGSYDELVERNADFRRMAALDQTGEVVT